MFFEARKPRATVFTMFFACSFIKCFLQCFLHVVCNGFYTSIAQHTGIYAVLNMLHVENPVQKFCRLRCFLPADSAKKIAQESSKGADPGGSGAPPYVQIRFIQA